jgi:hypothetical protein
MVMILGLGLLLAPAAHGEACKADVEASLQNMDTSGEAHLLVFEVKVRVDTDDCAAVDFEIVIEETGGEAEPKSVSKRSRVKVNGGEMTSVVHHQVTEGRRMADYRVELVSCQLCEAGD